MATTKVEIYGLKEVKERYSRERLSKVVAKEIALATLNLHGALKSAIFRRYTANNQLDKQLVRRSSTSSFGKSIVAEGSLVYRIKTADLSKFPTTWYWGNINAGASRQGRVHTVTVIRGGQKVVLGKGHRGGFQPRDSGGSPKRLFRGGSQMLERTSDKRFPLRVLYGPNTRNMISWALNNGPNVAKVMDNLVLDIIDNYI